MCSTCSVNENDHYELKNTCILCDYSSSKKKVAAAAAVVDGKVGNRECHSCAFIIIIGQSPSLFLAFNRRIAAFECVCVSVNAIHH